MICSEHARNFHSPTLPEAAAVTVIAPTSATMIVPAMIAELGEAPALRFIDFFTANIRNPNTRARPTPSPYAASSAGSKRAAFVNFVPSACTMFPPMSRC
jgi:hypothetical protein